MDHPFQAMNLAINALSRDHSYKFEAENHVKLYIYSQLSLYHQLVFFAHYITGNYTINTICYVGK